MTKGKQTSPSTPLLPNPAEADVVTSKPGPRHVRISLQPSQQLQSLLAQGWKLAPPLQH